MRLAEAYRSFFVAVLLWMVASSALGGTENPVERKAIPIDLWVGGDDGLTQRLASAVRAAIVASPEFVVADDRSKRPLRLEIPTHVDWQLVGDKTSINYVVIFTDSNSKYLGGSFDGCWESEISKCARKIISDLKLALAHSPATAAP